MLYHKTSNKRTQQLLEHGLRSSRRLLEVGIYLTFGVYQ